ncbi:DUF6314 family protein [Variovorax sp. DAIF25]|uniref:DUF6314 family protein n=1 Tax=Variovorax sp. DAIF25 TaxID=3080983 RepID=UPI003D6B9ECC
MQAPDPTLSLSPWGEADEVWARLAGGWTFERTIEGQASMHGTAVFGPLPGAAHATLHYREEGRLRLLDGRAFDAHREYLYQGRPGGFAVLFAEQPPRLFHEIALQPGDDEASAWIGTAAHPCAADLYDSLYRFLADGSFTLRHTVRGPRKDYVSLTRFRAAT